MKALLCLFVSCFAIWAWADENPFNPANPPAQRSSALNSDSNWHFALGLGLSVNSATRFDDGNMNGQSLTADMDYSNGAVLAFEGRIMPQQSWGVQLGLQLDSQRNQERGSFNLGGTTVATANDSKIQIHNLYANAVYRWEQFYIPFGINLDSVKFSTDSASSSASGGLGGQLAFGWMFTNQWAGEFISRVSAVRLKTTSSSGVVSDFGNGYFATVVLMGKYVF